MAPPLGRWSWVIQSTMAGQQAPRIYLFPYTVSVSVARYTQGTRVYFSPEYHISVHHLEEVKTEGNGSSQSHSQSIAKRNEFGHGSNANASKSQLKRFLFYKSCNGQGVSSQHTFSNKATHTHTYSNKVAPKPCLEALLPKEHALKLMSLWGSFLCKPHISQTFGVFMWTKHITIIWEQYRSKTQRPYSEPPSQTLFMTKITWHFIHVHHR